jgi:hypothetical protein
MLRHVLAVLVGVALVVPAVWSDPIPDTEGKEVIMSYLEAYPGGAGARVGLEVTGPEGAQGLQSKGPWGEASCFHWPGNKESVAWARVRQNPDDPDPPYYVPPSAHASPWAGEGEAAVLEAQAWVRFELVKSPWYSGPPLNAYFNRAWRIASGYLSNWGASTESRIEFKVISEYEELPTPKVLSAVAAIYGDDSAMVNDQNAEPIPEDVRLGKWIVCKINMTKMAAKATSPCTADAALLDYIEHTNTVSHRTW